METTTSKPARAKPEQPKPCKDCEHSFFNYDGLGPQGCWGCTHPRNPQPMKYPYLAVNIMDLEVFCRLKTS